MYNIFSSVIYSATQFCLNLIALLMNWIFQLIDCIGLSESNTFFGIIERDFIAQIFPQLNAFSADFTVIGYFIAFVLFIFGLFMLLFPYSDFEPPAENAFQLVFRFGVALIMVFGFEKFFLEVLYDKLIVPMFNYFNGAVGVTESVWNGTEWFLDTIKGRISAGHTSEISQILNFILVIIFGLMFIIQALKFTIYHYEKLFFTRLLIYCLPIASGTLATKKSSSVFKNYFNMLLINCISLIINVFICGLIMSGLLNLNTAANKAATDWQTQLNGGFLLTSTKTFIVGLMLLTAALKVGKKMSVYISQLFNMNGMSDAVKDGLGMFSMAIGYAGHMASQQGMRSALKKQNEEKNQIAKETNTELHNIGSHLGDLKDNYGEQAYANGYNEAMLDKDTDEAMEKSGLNNIKSVDLDESVNEENNGTDTEKSKPSSPDNYNNPLDNKDNVKGADTENGQSSDNKHNENSEMDGKNTKAADTANGLNSSELDKDSEQPNNSESKDSQNINAASTQTPNTQTDNDNNKSNPDSSEHMDKKDAVQTDNSQIQNNQKAENGADTEKGNIQNNSKYENSQNNTQSQNGINTENTNSSALNNNQSEGKNIDNSNSTVNGGKSVQNNETNSSAVNAGNHSSVLEKKSSNGSGAANISSGDRNSYHSGSSNSSVQQNNVSTVQNSSSVNHSTSSSKNSTSSNSHSVNTSGNGNSGNNISSNNNRSQRNSVNTNTVHTQSGEVSNADNHGRTPHRNHKTQNDHKTEI